MAVKKSVAASAKTSIPATASGAVELEDGLSVTVSQAEGPEPSSAVDAVAKTRSNNLAKARAARKAKALRAQALEEASIEAEASTRNAAVASFQKALAAEAKQDKHAFGEIREVARVAPTAEEYVRVEIPLADLFDHSHPGVQLNRHKFEPGKTYLLRGDVALEVKRRLAMFHDEQVRLLGPNADRKALNDVNRGSQWTSRGGNAVVPLGSLQDIQVGSDEKIYTVDF